MALIRATALQGYPELVRSLGGNPDRLLRAARIPRGAVGQFDTYLGFRNVISAIESAASATGAPNFGRQLAQRQGIEILGPVGAAARTAGTVADALDALREYLSVYCPAVEVAILPHNDERYAVIDLQVTLTPAPELRQTTELILGITRRILLPLIGSDFRPVAVHLPHDPLGPEREYRRYFGGPTRFREPFSGYTIRRSDLERPLTDDSDAHDALRAYLNSLTQTGAPDLIESVQLVVRHLLPSRALTIDVVAGQLGIHTRTLQRRLSGQSTTYEAVVDEVRKDLAARLLRDTNMPMTQLAGVLGYSEQSVLVWACRRWFDATPSQHRKALQGRADARTPHRLKRHERPQTGSTMVR